MISTLRLSRVRKLLLVILILSAGGGFCSLDGQPQSPAAEPPEKSPAQPAPGISPGQVSPKSDPAKEDEVQVPPPPLSPDIFPCTQCHAGMEVNPKRRVLEQEHTHITLHHDEEHRWCLDCHSADNRDKLHLASGALIDFTESYKLCGQCHGPNLRDWKAGVHGKRTGSWSGKKQYLLCVHCHDPHSPKFKPITPEPPPVRPEHLQ